MSMQRPGNGETKSGSNPDSIQPTDHTLFVDAPPTIGTFRLDVLLGRGGMGEVWRAHDTNLERDVALKLMRRELNENTEAVKRFMREARAVARLNHPNIVQIYTFGEINGAMYFVMELVEGCTVTQDIRAKGKIPLEDAVAIALQSIEGLDYALNRGIVHRDIKPSNLMLRPDGLVKIADFGLAKIRAAESQMTAAGSTMGSPNYMSPEQARGEEADHRSDMYSLGITLYQMLTGELPFTADSPLSVLLKQIQEPLPEPQFLQDILDGRLLSIIKRMTAKHVERRYADYREVAAELDAAVPGARRKMGGASSLSSTSSYPTPDPSAVRAASAAAGIPESEGSAPPPLPASPPPVPTAPAAQSGQLSGTGSSLPTYHREGAPQSATASLDSVAAKPASGKSGRLLASVLGVGVLVAAVLIAARYLRPPADKPAQNPTVASSPTPGVTPKPSPTPAPNPSPTASPSPSPTATPAAQPTPTPIVIVVQSNTPAPVATATPAIVQFTPAPTPVQLLTTIERGILAPDMPAGTAIPVRPIRVGGPETLPAQTQVQILRAVNAPDGGSGYIVRVGQAEFFVAASNIRVETRTSVGTQISRPTPNMARTPVRATPLVIQLGAPTDTAPSVPVYRDAAAIYELRVLPRGTEVTVAGTERDSYQVILSDGKSGYVLKKSTSPKGTIPTPQP